MIATLLSIVPAEIWTLAASAVAVALAFVGGRWGGKKQGRTEAERDALERDSEAVTRRDRKREEVGKDDDKALIDRLLNRKPK